jgi:hypothetical protein
MLARRKKLIQDSWSQVAPIADQAGRVIISPKLTRQIN